MEAREYERMHQLEQSFWWYRGLHEVSLQRIHSICSALGNKSVPDASSTTSQTIQLLDAGCGTGGLLQRLTQAPALNLQCQGLDFDKQALAYCQQKNPHTTLTHGSINHLPFADKYFDIVVCNDVFYHREVNPAQAATECLRVLKPGGSFLVHVPAYNWLQSAHDQHVHGSRRYTRNTLSQLLSQAGFQVQRCAYWNSLLFPLMVLHRLGNGRHKTHSDVEETANWLNTILYRIINSENALQQQGVTLPFGGSVWGWAKRPH